MCSWFHSLVPSILGAALILGSVVLEGQPAPDYKNPKCPVDRRVKDLLGRMTKEEKARMLAGAGWMETASNERLGIPAIRMADGPLGVRNWSASSAITSLSTTAPIYATAFPAGLAMAASWDTELVKAEGRAIAQDVKALGRDMILGPTVNISRTPLWGRNFEGYGEDPFLAARMGVAYIKGVQAEGVIACVKHFAANNEEFERHRIDEKIDSRTLHEIYFPAFKAAIQEADAWTVMSAYNKVNGQNCAENAFLLTDVLKRKWGFKGFVISDWGSTYGTASTINAGMDLEMPGGASMKGWADRPEFLRQGRGAGWLAEEKVLAALSRGEVKQEIVDENVGRILRVMFSAGLFEAPVRGGELDTPARRALARTAAIEGMVLLKNEGKLLPLDSRKTRKIAIIGPSAAVARTGGGGSSLVRPKYAVTPLEGIKEALGPDAQVEYALGVAMEGEEPSGHLQEAAALAARSEVAIVVVGYSPKLESEGADRKSMDLPAGQDELIEAVAAANKNTIVVIAAGAPVTLTKWIGKVTAVLFAWYAGQEEGHAVADLLFGAANPSGKLPVTYAKRIEDSTAFGNYPGENLHVNYAEGIYVGYRGFDARKVEPLFPFGYGLSYSDFVYSDLKLSAPRMKTGQKLQVSLKVRNSSKRAGAEVVQLYVHDVKASVDRPEKELKAFHRVMLKPGETKTVSLTLDESALSFFDPTKDEWTTEPGVFQLLIGASSRDIRLKGNLDLVK